MQPYGQRVGVPSFDTQYNKMQTFIISRYLLHLLRATPMGLPVMHPYWESVSSLL